MKNFIKKEQSMPRKNKKFHYNKADKVIKSINFLEHPLWTPKRFIKETSLTDKTGYRIESKFGVPNSNDIDVLNILLARQQQNPEKLEVEIENYPLDIIKEINASKTSEYYERIEYIIKKWSKVDIYFPNGVFYYDKRREGREIARVINNVIDLNKTRTKVIVFNKSFINANNDGTFKKTFNLNFLQSITPFSKRLYEILCKSFYSNDIFSITRENLLDKMFLGNKEILKFEKRALRRIEKAMLEINFKSRPEGDREKMPFFYFLTKEEMEKEMEDKILPDSILFFKRVLKNKNEAEKERNGIIENQSGIIENHKRG